VHNAFLRTIEDGIHTYDIAKEGKNPYTTKQVGTKEFGDAIVARLGQEPQKLKPVRYIAVAKQADRAASGVRPVPQRDLVGVDLFFYNPPGDPIGFGQHAETLNGGGLKLIMVSNRGVKVYPDGLKDTLTCDHWRVRFQSDNANPQVAYQQVIDLMQRANSSGFEIIKTEGLYNFDGKPGFSLSQGQ